MREGLQAAAVLAWSLRREGLADLSGADEGQFDDQGPKRLLNLKKVMNKQQEQMEKVVLLVYAIGLLVLIGEALWDWM